MNVAHDFAPACRRSPRYVSDSAVDARARIIADASGAPACESERIPNPLGTTKTCQTRRSILNACPSASKRSCARRARSRLRYFRDGAKRWTKGDDSPVTEADIAVDRFLGAASAAAGPGLGLAVGGDRGRRRPAGPPPRLDRRPDRRHPRLRRGPPGMGGLGRPWSRTACRSRASSTIRARTRLFGPRAAAARRATASARGRGRSARSRGLSDQRRQARCSAR